LNSLGRAFLIVVLDDLLELLEFGVVIQEEGVNGEKTVSLLGYILLPFD
jgi:hypothetical protein